MGNFYHFLSYQNVYMGSRQRRSIAQTVSYILIFQIVNVPLSQLIRGTPKRYIPTQLNEILSIWNYLTKYFKNVLSYIRTDWSDQTF